MRNDGEKPDDKMNHTDNFAFGSMVDEWHCSATCIRLRAFPFFFLWHKTYHLLLSKRVEATNIP